MRVNDAAGCLHPMPETPALRYLSFFGSQADAASSLGYVRLVPKADSCSAAKAVWLFDDLVGEQLDRIWHLDTEQPGGLHVDHELESRGLIDRQVGGLLALGIRAT